MKINYIINYKTQYGGSCINENNIYNPLNEEQKTQFNEKKEFLQNHLLIDANCNLINMLDYLKKIKINKNKIINIDLNTIDKYPINCIKKKLNQFKKSTYQKQLENIKDSIIEHPDELLCNYVKNELKPLISESL